jgi:hypothetical protein
MNLLYLSLRWCAEITCSNYIFDIFINDSSLCDYSSTPAYGQIIFTTPSDCPPSNCESSGAWFYCPIVYSGVADNGPITTLANTGSSDNTYTFTFTVNENSSPTLYFVHEPRGNFTNTCICPVVVVPQDPPIICKVTIVNTTNQLIRVGSYNSSPCAGSTYGSANGCTVIIQGGTSVDANSSVTATFTQTANGFFAGN